MASEAGAILTALAVRALAMSAVNGLTAGNIERDRRSESALSASDLPHLFLYDLSAVRTESEFIQETHLQEVQAALVVLKDDDNTQDEAIEAVELWDAAITVEPSLGGLVRAAWMQEWQVFDSVIGPSVRIARMRIQWEVEH